MKISGIVIIIIACITFWMLLTPKNIIINAEIENSAVMAYLDGEISVEEANSKYGQINREWPQPIDFKEYISDGQKYRLCLSSDAGHMEEYDSKEGDLQIYNLIPQKTYNFKLFEQKGKKYNLKQFGIIQPKEAVRMLKLESIHNVRDVGGWHTASGQKVRYGMIYRGSEMNGHFEISDKDRKILRRDLGITVDLDFRGIDESGGITLSPIGTDVRYIRIPIQSYTDYVEEPGNSIAQIIQTVADDGVIYMHCWGGCDRTGTICYLLLGLLGVSEEALIKDYELSTFSVFGNRSVEEGIYDFAGMSAYMKGLEGDSLQEKIENWFIQNGVNKNEIERFKYKMLENDNK